MDRDMRLTGVFRAQTDNPQAPLGFEVNNPWKARHKTFLQQELILTNGADGGKNGVKERWFSNLRNIVKTTNVHTRRNVRRKSKSSVLSHDPSDTFADYSSFSDLHYTHPSHPILHS